MPEEDQDAKSSESQADLNYKYEEPDHATFYSWLTTQDVNFKRAMRVLNHKEAKNYLRSPRKGRNEPQINTLLHKTRGQSSQYAQVLYIMRNYLNQSKEQGEEQDYRDYLVTNLDKIYFVNFDNGLISERDQQQKVLQYELDTIGKPFDIIEITERVDFYQKLQKVITFNLQFELRKGTAFMQHGSQSIGLAVPQLEQIKGDVTEGKKAVEEMKARIAGNARRAL